MKRSLTNVQLWMIIAASVAVYVPLALFPPRQLAFEAIDVMCVALAVGGASSYLREAWNALKLPVHKMVSAHYIVTGVFFTATSMAILFTGLWFWRIHGQPRYIIDSALILFSRWLAVIALALFMLTSYSRGGVVSITAYKWPTIITGITLAVIIALWILLIGRF